MIKLAVTAVLYAFAMRAGDMSEAGQKAYVVDTSVASRLWRAIGAFGTALETRVDRVAARCGINISAVMIDRAYGW